MHQRAFACTPGMLSFHLYQAKPHPCSVVHSGITLSRKPPFVCSRSFLHAISRSSGCSGVSTIRVSVPPQGCGPSRAGSICSILMSSPLRQSPGRSWRLRRKCLFNRGMKDFGILISWFASNMISIFHVSSPGLDRGEGESRGPSPVLKSSQTAAGAEDVLSQGFRHGVLRVLVGAVTPGRAKTAFALALVPCRGLSTSQVFPAVMEL